MTPADDAWTPLTGSASERSWHSLAWLRAEGWGPAQIPVAIRQYNFKGSSTFPPATHRVWIPHWTRGWHLPALSLHRENGGGLLPAVQKAQDKQGLWKLANCATLSWEHRCHARPPQPCQSQSSGEDERTRAWFNVDYLLVSYYKLMTPV